MLRHQRVVLRAGRRQHSPAAHGVRWLPVPVDDHHAEHADSDDELYVLAGQLDACDGLAY